MYVGDSEKPMTKWPTLKKTGIHCCSAVLQKLSLFWKFALVVNNFAILSVVPNVKGHYLSSGIKGKENLINT